MSHQLESERSEEPPSSFPISSPSFWTEVANGLAPAVPASAKRPRSDGGWEDNMEDGEDVTREKDDNDEASPTAKRARQEAPQTTLSYLPNRLDPFTSDDPHSYLANAEYAPNKFGDIGDYMRKKEVKVQTQNRDIAIASAAEGTPQIFTGLSFWINGNTHPPMEEIRKLILQRGGEVRPVLRSKGMVKFIIAPMLTQMKFKQFANYKVVREAWITESCKEGKLLDWSRWKLQIQGGWEESGRKGLEDFLGGNPSQAVVGDDTIKEEDETIATDDLDSKRQINKEAEIAQAESKPVLPVSAATQSLLRPMRNAPIPISPGAAKAETPDKEMVPAKVHKPEGVWEHYYSKDSNVDAARLMKDQEWRIKNTAERGNEGGFIDGYYQNSRLHHLSTWKAELKVLVAAAQRQSEEQSLAKPSSTSVSPYTLANSTLPRAAQATAAPGERVIFHVDFDCFFVSCGLATRPHLKGKPVVVCHSQAGKRASSTSEIASASYEARDKGVKNGMSLGRARTLVGKELQTIPYEFDTYKKYSLAFYTVLMGYADELQAVSVDEALVDVTSAVAARALEPEEAPDELLEDAAPEVERKPSRDPAIEVADRIRDEVRALTDGCEDYTSAVSIGIAHNVLLAKLATRKAKPAGIFHLIPASVPDFIAPLDVEDFPSIGYSIRGRIEEKFGTRRCGDLLQHPVGAFRALLGPKTGDMVFGYLRGNDPKKLEPHKERKSISAEMNYGIRFQNQEQAEICVKDLGAEVAKRMKQVNFRGRLLTLKLMSRHPDAPIEAPKFLGHGWCETFNKSTAIANKGGSATDDPDILGIEAIKLLRVMKLDPVELRGVGIQITKLEGEKVQERDPGQGTLSFGRKRTRSDLKVKKLEESRSVTPAAVIDQPTVVNVPQDNETDENRSHPTSPASTQRSPSPESGGLETTLLPKEVTIARKSPPLTRRRSTMLEAQAGPSRLPATSSDGLDPEFLAALPPSLRQEVKRDYGRSRTVTEPPIDVEDASPTRELETVTKDKGKHPAAHITRQLRPKLKTQLRATAIADLPLYGAWAKAGDQPRDQLRDEMTNGSTVDDEDDVAIIDDGESIGPYRVSELRLLGIEPTVFSELPEEMRREIVVEERRKSRQRKALHRPGDASRLKAKEREYARTASLSPSKTSRAGSNPPQPRALISVSVPPKPTLLKAQTLPDVLETVTKWIESRKGGPPAARDSGRVKTYLLRCMEPNVGAGGMENAVEVLKWMRAILSEQWLLEDEDIDASDGEFMEGDLEVEGRRERTKAGKLWWETWRQFKTDVDEIAIRRFGAPLRL